MLLFLVCEACAKCLMKGRYSDFDKTYTSLENTAREKKILIFNFFFCHGQFEVPGILVGKDWKGHVREKTLPTCPPSPFSSAEEGRA
jgi:hypothetical protein